MKLVTILLVFVVLALGVYFMFFWNPRITKAPESSLIATSTMPVTSSAPVFKGPPAGFPKGVKGPSAPPK